MDKTKRYYGIILFVVFLVLIIVACVALVLPQVDKLNETNSTIEEREAHLEQVTQKAKNVEMNIKKLRESNMNSQKKIYTPIESDLGSDTLFFTLYNDVIEMLHANTIKIKSIDYVYNPETDEFVKFGRDVYFVCDINMELVSNYVNLGKLIQDIYQYPYYIKINDLEVKPYTKDKKVLISNLSLRLYAHTAPEIGTSESVSGGAEEETLKDASIPLPKE